MASTTTPKLSELAALISQKAAFLEKYLEDNSLPQPSFSADGPLNFPIGSTAQNVNEARFALIDAAKDLRDLVVGPEDSLKWLVLNDHNLSASLQAAYHFKIAQAVPLTGSISFTDLSEAVKIDEMNLARIVRLLITEHIFAEPMPGFVAHSASSLFIATDSSAQAVVGHMLEGAFTSSARMVEALDKFKGSQDPAHSAWTLNFGAPFFAYMSEHPEVFLRFAACMQGWSGNFDFNAHMATSFDWSSLGDGLVVDIGGAQGQISIALAEKFPSLRFLVQDLPPNSSGANEAIVTKCLENRVKFLAHDFFSPQPDSAKEAAAYLMRYIVHDWSDEYARKILRNVVAAMGPESRLIIADAVLPPPGVVPLAQEKTLRAFDVSMFVQLNARERALEDWQALLTSVDSRLKITGVKPPPPGISVSVLEVRLS